MDQLALADGIEPLHRVKASLDEWSLTFLKVLVFNYIERAGWPCVINYWMASQVPTSHVAPNLFSTGDQWLAEVCDEHCRYRVVDLVNYDNEQMTDIR